MMKSPILRVSDFDQTFMVGQSHLVDHWKTIGKFGGRLGSEKVAEYHVIERKKLENIIFFGSGAHRDALLSLGRTRRKIKGARIERRSIGNPMCLLHYPEGPSEIPCTYCIVLEVHL